MRGHPNTPIPPLTRHGRLDLHSTLGISKTYNITVQASSSAEARRIVEAMFAGSDIRVSRVSGAGG